jgi:hypothetical protein
VRSYPKKIKEKRTGGVSQMVEQVKIPNSNLQYQRERERKEGRKKRRKEGRKKGRKEGRKEEGKKEGRKKIKEREQIQIHPVPKVHYQIKCRN